MINRWTTPLCILASTLSTCLCLGACDPSGLGSDMSDEVPTVLGLTLDMKEQDVPGALKAISSLSFNSTSGVPKAKVTFNGAIRLDEKVILSIQLKEQRFVLGSPFSFTDWPMNMDLADDVLLDATLAPQIGAMVDSLKSEIVTKVKQVEQTRSKGAEQAAGAAAKEIGNQASLLRKKASELIATEGRCRSQEAIDAAKEVIRRFQRSHLTEEWETHVMAWMNVVTNPGEGKRANIDIESSSQALLKAGEDLISGKSVETPKLISEGIPDIPDANNLLRTGWELLQGPCQQLREATTTLSSTDSSLDAKVRTEIESTLVAMIEAASTGKTIPKSNAEEHFTCSETKDLFWEFQHSLNDVRLRFDDLKELLVASRPVSTKVEADYRVGDRVYVDDAREILIVIDDEKESVKTIVFSTAFSNRLFGAAEMSPKVFLGKFCEAYGIPADGAIIDAASDETVTDAGSTVAFLDQMMDSKIRKYDNHEAGYRLVAQGKTIGLTRIPRISESALGK